MQANRTMGAIPAIQPRNASSIYFGKIASRGDFVKSTSGAEVIALIDKWVAQGMELLIADPDWKNSYDTAGPVDFLFIGTRRKRAISGALIPGRDASVRRFPFIAATLFEMGEALVFLPLSPLVMERHANHQRALSHHASTTHDAAETLTALGDVALLADAGQHRFHAEYAQFLNTTSLASLATALSPHLTGINLRQTILAVGYLLQPVLANYAIAPHRGLLMPLPADPGLAPLVKAWWLDLVCSFLPRADFELGVFSCRHDGRPVLILTFNGITPAVFHALFGGAAAQQSFIDISYSAWVEEYAARDATRYKLSSYLEHGELTLGQLREAFRQAFSG